MSVLWGDPASLSVLGATLRRTAVTLAADGEAVGGAREDVSVGWAGPRAVRTRRRIDVAAGASADIAAALDEVGRSLQSASTGLAATIARLRQLEDEARDAGLQVRDGTVHSAWGITGLADAGAVREGEDRRLELQERFHAALSRLGRQRARLSRDCERASLLLREATASLRA